MNRILLIDNNTFFRISLKEILQFKFPSMMIEEASNGTEGLKKIADFHPQLLFLDIQLSGEDGFKLARKIRTEHPNIIIVLFTSYELEEYKTEARKAGMDHVIPKNLWSSEGILALVQTILSGGGPGKNGPPREAGAENDFFPQTPQRRRSDEDRNK